MALRKTPPVKSGFTNCIYPVIRLKTSKQNFENTLFDKTVAQFVAYARFQPVVKTNVNK